MSYSTNARVALCALFIIACLTPVPNLLAQEIPSGSDSGANGAATIAIQNVERAEANGYVPPNLIANALPLVEKAVQESPLEYSLREKAVEFAIKTKRFGSALEHLVILLNDSDSDTVSLRTSLAECLHRTGKRDLAIAELSDLLGYDSASNTFNDTSAVTNDVKVFKALADITFETELRPSILDRMIEVNPHSHDAYIARAQFRDKYPVAFRVSDVESDVLTAVELGPDSPDALLHAGNFYLQRGKFDVAFEHYDACRKKFPNNAEVYYRLACWARKNRKEALPYLKEGLKRAEDNTDMLWMSAGFHLTKQDFKKVELVRDRLETLQYHPSHLTYLDGRLAFAKGNWADASKSFESVQPWLAATNATHIIDTRLAYCYSKLGKHDQALIARDRAATAKLHADLETLKSMLLRQRQLEAMRLYNKVEESIFLGFEKLIDPELLTLLQLELNQQRNLPKDEQSFEQASKTVREIRRRELDKQTMYASLIDFYYQAVGREQEPQRSLEEDLGLE